MLIQQVCVIYVFKRGSNGRQVLLGRKLTGLGTGKVVAPGGKLEAGEGRADAARRELCEEVGSELTYADLTEVGVNRYRFPTRPAWHQDSHVFRAKWVSGIPEVSTELEPFWVPIEQVPYGEMWADAAKWLPAVLTGCVCEGEYTFGSDLTALLE